MRAWIRLTAASLLVATIAQAAHWNLANLSGEMREIPTVATTTTSVSTTTSSTTKIAATATSAPAATQIKIAAVQREFSAPEWTLKTFAEAIRLNDVDAFISCFESPPQDDTVTPIYMQVVINAVKLRRAGMERFGDEAGGNFEVSSLSPSLESSRQAALGGRLRKAGGATLLRINDEITIQLDQDPDTKDWKIDPASYVGVRPNQMEPILKQLPVMKAIATALEDSRAEIAAGKHANASAAGQAFRFHLMDMMKKAKTAATTGPATTRKAESGGD